MYKSFTSLDKFISKYFIGFEVIVNEITHFSDNLFSVNRNTTDTCTLILYPETLLNLLLISLQSFLYKRSCHLQRDNFTSSHLIWMLFTSFSCLTALTRTSSTMLNRSDESERPSLPNFRGKAFSISLLSMMLAVDLHT